MKCSYDHTIKIWDTRSIFPLETLASHHDKVFSILWKGRLLVTEITMSWCRGGLTAGCAHSHQSSKARQSDHIVNIVIIRNYPGLLIISTE